MSRPAGHATLLGEAARRILHTLRLWRERIRGRNDLARLDERMLADIGLTRPIAISWSTSRSGENNGGRTETQRRGAVAAVCADVAGSAVAALRRRSRSAFRKFAEQPPSSPRELPPEWFRFPLP